MPEDLKICTLILFGFDGKIESQNKVEGKDLRLSQREF
jgi:hypothetical protein